jgi:hypothetical protein
MKDREIRLVLDVCREVDWLVTQDSGTVHLEVLERARLKMNDLLSARKWREAEKVAYVILLARSGHEAEAYSLEDIGD